MVFRSHNRNIRNDRSWNLNEANIAVVKEFKYLGFIVTNNLSIGPHIKDKSSVAKAAINCIWSSFFSNKNVDPTVKFKVFNATIKSSLCYANEVYGHTMCEDFEVIQRYFFKRVFRIPSNTPNYAIYIESGLPPIFLKNLKANADYIVKVLSRSDDSLQRKMLVTALRRNYSPFKEWQVLAVEYNCTLNLTLNNLESWKDNFYDCISIIDEKLFKSSITRANASMTRTVYSKLNLCLGVSNYFRNEFTVNEISLLFKIRTEMIELNYRPHREDIDHKCSLCNLNQIENVYHFLARCPILQEIRRLCFNRSFLSTEECYLILNGESGWKDLIRFVSQATAYRNMYVNLL